MVDRNKSRLARLTAILTQLRAKRLSTARELAEQHQVSIRTIYRDIRTLEESGVPIVTIEGKGYTLMNGYQLPPVMFSEQEANALITVAQLIENNQDQSLVTQYQQAITKIKSVMQYAQQDKVELLAERIQIRHTTADTKSSHYLSILQIAITNFNLVEITYTSLNDAQSKRVIEPFAVYSAQGNWVLIAYCRLRQDFRAFRIDHIDHLTVRSDHFEDHQLTLHEYFEICRKKYLNTPDIPLS